MLKIIREEMEELNYDNKNKDEIRNSLPMYLLHITKKDYPQYKETAWSLEDVVYGPDIIYIVEKNGESNYSVDYIVENILSEYPELSVGENSRENHIEFIRKR